MEVSLIVDYELQRKVWAEGIDGYGIVIFQYFSVHALPDYSP